MDIQSIVPYHRALVVVWRQSFETVPAALARPPGLKAHEGILDGWEERLGDCPRPPGDASDVIGRSAAPMNRSISEVLSFTAIAKRTITVGL
jgi:hypothetical protein